MKNFHVSNSNNAFATTQQKTGSHAENIDDHVAFIHGWAQGDVDIAYSSGTLRNDIWIFRFTRGTWLRLQPTNSWWPKNIVLQREWLHNLG